MFESPNNFYFWCVSGISVLVGVDTVLRLWTERHRFPKDNLTDDDRAMIWRIVLFLVFPLFTLLELKATQVGILSFGGEMKSWSYGLLWYEAVPKDLPTVSVIPAIFSGEFVILCMAACMLPALLFRPHPFLATLVGYTVSFICAVSLIIEPAIAVTGFSSSKWNLAFASGAPEQILPLAAIHVILAGIYILVIKNKAVRMWFSDLTRPEASDRLKAAIFELRSQRNSARALSKLGILYEKAGLQKQAKEQLQALKKLHSNSIYTYFLDGFMAYSERKFSRARSSFLYASDICGGSYELKAHLLAAAACASFADGEIVQAVNLSERALEKDESYLVARMVKVDALLRMGRKDQAAQEILIAVHSGLTLDLENKIPLEVEKSFALLEEHEELSAPQGSQKKQKLFEVVGKN